MALNDALLDLDMVGCRPQSPVRAWGLKGMSPPDFSATSVLGPGKVGMEGGLA